MEPNGWQKAGTPCDSRLFLRIFRPGKGFLAHSRRATQNFATTQWSVVLTAQGESPAAQEALEKLCRTYWRPIFAFVRREGIEAADAEDLTQGFFALLLERRDLDAVRKEKGRLRSYLLTSLKHFWQIIGAMRWRSKRGRRERVIPLEELRANEQVDSVFARATDTFECRSAI